MDECFRYVNVVILSDHGMSYGHHPTQENININKIRLTEHLEHGTYRFVQFVINLDGMEDGINKQFVRGTWWKNYGVDNLSRISRSRISSKPNIHSSF